MPAETLLLVSTPRQRFVVSNSDVHAIRPVVLAEPEAPHVVFVPLGFLLNSTDISMQKRQHGMVIPLRRKQVTFLVDRVDMLSTRPRQHPLPRLLVERLHTPWSLHAFEIEHELVIQLDIRAIARSLLSTPLKQSSL